ncbi:MAG: hypothetical protein AAGD04_13070 [Pseudomonadota bacterium]
MSILIVESDLALAQVWAGHLRRQDHQVTVATSQDAAAAALADTDVRVVILNLDLANGSALAVADFASYRRPNARVLFVTKRSFFSDGSIFKLAPNAAGFMGTSVKPEDLTALVDHHAALV